MNCQQCDLPFQQAPRNAGRIKRYCSITCRTSSYKDKHYRQSYYKPKGRAAKTKVCCCVQCGKEFTGPMKRPRKTCSKECAYSRKMFTNTRYSKVHKTFRAVKREPTPKYVNPNGVCPPSYRQQLARECYK